MRSEWGFLGPKGETRESLVAGGAEKRAVKREMRLGEWMLL